MGGVVVGDPLIAEQSDVAVAIAKSHVGL